jgi:hypothetical protein
MTAAMIGTGRAFRVCDLCGGVDDHPRHVIAGGTPEDVFPRPTTDMVRLVMENATRAKLDTAAADRALADLLDTTSSDRHIDCCAAAGCPNGLCDVQMRSAGSKTGRAMMDHLIDLEDVFAGRDDVVRALTQEQVDAGRKVTSKMLRSQTALLFGMLMLATRGLSAVNLSNAWLNVISGTTFTGAAGSFIGLHTADPGAAGATATSSVVTRPSATWNAASAGVKTISNTPSWTSWAGTSPETVTDISDWSAASAGTFYFSVALTASKTVQTGDTLTLNSLSLSQTPLAA